MYDRGVVKLFDKAVTSKRRKARTNHTVPPPALTQPTAPLPNNSNISFRLPGLGPQRVEPCFNRSCLTFDSSQLNMPIHSISHTIMDSQHAHTREPHNESMPWHRREYAATYAATFAAAVIMFMRRTHGIMARELLRSSTKQTLHGAND